ncbi:hypothetical protein ACLKA6_013706 [Drosophila palustris]
MPPLSPADTGPTPDGQCPESTIPHELRDLDCHLRPEVLPPQSMQCLGYAAMCRCVLLVRSPHQFMSERRRHPQLPRRPIQLFF